MNNAESNPSIRPADDEDDLDLAQLLNTLWAGKWLILAVTLLALAVGTAYALFSTPIYSSDALLQVEPQQSLLAGLGLGEEGQPQVRDPKAAAEIEILRSRTLLGRVVEQLGLDIVVEPLRFPIVGGWLARRHAATHTEPAPARFGLQRYAWGGERIQVSRLEVPDALRGVPLHLVAGEAGLYTLYTQSGQRLLQGKAGEPARGEGAAPVQLFVAELQARPGSTFLLVKNHPLASIGQLRAGFEVEEQGSGTGILRLTLEGPDPQRIREILDEIANLYVRQNVERHSAEAQQRLQFVEEQLPGLKHALDEAEQRYSQYRQREKAVDLAGEASNLLAQVVEVDRQLVELKLQQAELGQSFAEQHPRIIALRQQMGQLQGVRNQLEKKIGALPESQQALLRLQRDVDVASALYVALLNQAQELRIARAGTVGNVRVIDHAVAGGLAHPKKPIVLAIAGFLGALLGCGIVFLLRLLHRGITDPNALEQALGLATYAVVPYSAAFQRLRRHRPRRPVPVLVRELPQDISSESLRSLRTSLHFALRNGERKVVVVTSAAPNAGKSFLCINLAHLLADTGLRVLLIDADLRAGKLGHHLVVQGADAKRTGLADVLSGACGFDDAVHPLSPNPHVHLIPAGARPPNPAELLMGERFDGLLERAQQSYDLVLIDTAPVLPVTDGVLVAARGGAVFMAVRAHVDTVDALEEAIRRLQQAKVPVAGAVLNGLLPKQGLRSYGYNYGYYHYRYPTDQRA